MKKGFVGEILFLALIIVFVVFSGYYFIKGRVMSGAKAKTINSPVSHLESEGLPKPFLVVDNSSDLTKVVNQALEGTHGTYGIVIKNLKTGERFEQNAHTVFPPASMYKLWVMAVVFDQIEQGKMTMDTSMSADVMNLNRKFHIDKENAELREGGFTFTIEEALERMIVVSHNYAAYMLTDKIGLKSIAPFLRNNGFLESKVGVDGNLPTSTPADMALFFEKLYSGKLASPIVSEKMIALLKRQQLNYALPKFLPEGTVVAHKTGNIDEFTHDGGIVYSTNGDYIIVMMTKSDNPKSAEDRMANVSKAVWNYFER